MKKNKILAGVLLFAFIITGIAFAAIAKNLVVNGNAAAGANESLFVVEFTNAETNADATPTASATVGTEDKKTATITISGWTKKNDTASFTFTVQNKTTEAVGLDANLGTLTVNNPNTTYYTITTGDWSKTTLAPQETATFTVTVTLTKTPDGSAEAAEYTSEFTVSFAATASTSVDA